MMKPPFTRIGMTALIAIAAGRGRRSRSQRLRAVLQAQDCARRYVASGDHIPAGHEVEESERFPNHLLNDHLKKWGPWCLYNLAKNETTSNTYITEGSSHSRGTFARI